MKKITTLLTMVSLVFGTLCVKAQTNETHNFTNINKSIPDGNASGLSDVRTVTSAIVNPSSVRVKLRIAGEFNGDLYSYVRHIQGSATNFCVLLNRPGRTAANPAGYADAGLDVVFDDAVTNRDIHIYRAVTNLPAGTPLSGAWQPDGRRVDPGEVLDSTARTTTLSSFCSAEAAGEWTLYLADVESGGTNMLVSWELDFIGVATPPVTWPTPADIVYGTALGPAQLNATSSVPGTFTYNPPAGTILNAGSNQVLSATFTPTDTTNYVSVTNNVNINVLKAPLTITANSQSKTYGTVLVLGTTAFSVGSGLASGESVTAVTLTASGGTAATDPAGGSYTITPSAATGSGGFVAGNYSITYTPGTLTVNPLAVSLTGSRAYDGTTTAAAAILSVANKVGSDAVTVASGSGTLASANVGSRALTSFGSLALGGAAAANYTLTGASGTVTINGAPLTITANARSKTYGTVLVLGTTAFSVGSGLASGESVTAVTLTASDGTAATDPAGSYTITPSAATGTGGFLAGNYNITYTPGTLTVNPLAVSLTGSRAYNGTATAAASILTVANKVGSDDVTVASGSGTLAGANVGSRAITSFGSLALGGAAAANYTLTGASGTVTINGAPLTITANAQSKTYGTALVLGTTAFSVGSGLASGESVTAVTLTASGGTAATDPAGGSYTITPSAATGTGGFLAGNYSITYTPGTLTVNPLVVSLTGSRAYDGTTTAAAAILSVANKVGSDAVTVASGSGTLASANVGSRALTSFGSLALGGAAAANYTLTGASGTVTINGASLTITANAQSKTYGTALVLGTTAFSVGSGLASGESVTAVTLTANGGTAATDPADSYTITPSAATGTGGFLAGNYSITYTPGTLTVDKAATTGIVGSSQNPSRPGDLVTFTFTLSTVAPSTGTPTGNAQFKVDGTNAGTPAVLSNGVALYSTAALALGTHTVAAEYAGDENFIGTTNGLVPDQLVNTPPVANPDTIERDPTNGVKVLIAALLSNDIDADSDPITFLSVSATSTNGGTVVSNAGWIYYTPLPGFTNIDTFTYIISDNRGSSATGMVSINIKVDLVPAPNLVITNLPNGSYSIRFDGVPGKVYRIQFTENLETPDWQTLGSRTANEVGLFEYIDTPPEGSPRRFYRSVYP